MIFFCSLVTSVLAETNLDTPVEIFHTTEEIQLDGFLSEPFWEQSKPITTFARYMPTNGGPPPGKTEVRFVQHDDQIYIGIRVSQVDYPIQARISPREDVNDDDQIGIYIDPIGDGRTGYIFYLNALGIQQDIRYANGQWSVNWDTIFDTKGQVFEDGYTIEMKLPFKSIQYPDSGNWMVAITRKVPSLGAKYSHPARVRNHPQILLQSVPILGVAPPKQGAGLWIQPTLSGRHSLERIDNELFWTESEEHWTSTIRPSMDIRWGISPETVLTFTSNPDFSQVEGDISQINLNQRFAFFYPERRPFFLSNLDAFQDNASTLYTRSIVDPIFGAKIAGREGNWDFGVLTSLDKQPNYSVHEFSAPGFDSESLEDKWANTTFMRIRRDALNSGFIGITAANKVVTESSSVQSLAKNDVLSMDFRTNISEDVLFEGFSSWSNTNGGNEHIQGHRHKLSISKTPDLGFGFRSRWIASTDGYRQEMGFLNQSGFYSFFNKISSVYQMGEDSLWVPSLDVKGRYEFDDDSFFEVAHEQDFTIKGLHTVSIEGGWMSEDYQGNSVSGPSFSSEWKARINAKMNSILEAEYETSLDYGTGLAANNFQGSAKLLWRPQTNIRFGMDLAQQWYTLPNAQTESIQRVYSKFNYQLSQYLGTRFVTQTVHTNSSGSRELASVFGSVLISYYRNPGNEVYIGGTWNWNPSDVNVPDAPNTVLDEQMVLQQQMLFAKWTHLFQY